MTRHSSSNRNARSTIMHSSNPPPRPPPDDVSYESWRCAVERGAARGARAKFLSLTVSVKIPDAVYALPEARLATRDVMAASGCVEGGGVRARVPPACWWNA
jgi:hypothetical protein